MRSQRQECIHFLNVHLVTAACYTLDGFHPYIVPQAHAHLTTNAALHSALQSTEASSADHLKWLSFQTRHTSHPHSESIPLALNPTPLSHPPTPTYSTPPHSHSTPLPQTHPSIHSALSSASASPTAHRSHCKPSKTCTHPNVNTHTHLQLRDLLCHLSQLYPQLIGHGICKEVTLLQVPLSSARPAPRIRARDSLKPPSVLP